MRRWSRPVPLLLLGLVLLSWGVIDLRAEPAASVVTIDNSAPEASSAPGPASTDSAATVPVGSGPPSAVTLPGADIPVPIVPVGVLPTRALQLPEHPGTIGWWSAGPLPGSAQGTVVLAGHVDSAKYGAGPLRQLLTDELRGPIDVFDTEGAVHRYTVSSRQSYPKAGLPDDLFTGSGSPRLAFITCGGLFDQRTGHYADNVVVIATPAP